MCVTRRCRRCSRTRVARSARGLVDGGAARGQTKTRELTLLLPDPRCSPTLDLTSALPPLVPRPLRARNAAASFHGLPFSLLRRDDAPPPPVEPVEHVDEVSSARTGIETNGFSHFPTVCVAITVQIVFFDKRFSYFLSFRGRRVDFERNRA